MKIDWTLNVWQLITAGVFLFGAYGGVMRIYHLLDRRLSLLEQRLQAHADTLGDHGKRLQRYEESLFRIVGDLQRVVGRVEMQNGFDLPHNRRQTD